MTPSENPPEKNKSSLLKKWVDRASPGGERAKLLILKYHRANSTDMGKSAPSVANFESQAELLRTTFNTLTVSDASRRIKDGTLPPRALCITFDDGYADNFHVAMPILERHKLTATFFVPSGLLEESIMWSDQIASIFSTSGDRLKEVQKYLADCGMPIRYTELMNKLKYMSVDAQQTIVNGLSAYGQIDFDASKLMNTDQIRSIAQRGMEIGGHTVNHTILSNIDDDEARKEIAGCKTQLEAIIDAPVESFAYPNGRRDRDYAERDVNIVRESGFKTAVNTEFGLANGNAGLFELPRVAQYYVKPLRLFRLYL